MLTMLANFRLEVEHGPWDGKSEKLDEDAQ